MFVSTWLAVFFLPFLSLCSHSFLPHLFLCLRHSLCLSFSPVLVFFPQKTSAPFFLSFLSFHSALWKFIQRRAQFDSVSLVIQGSMEGELSLMDNLSGSICHYYALPPKPRKHSSDKKVNNHQNDDSLPPFHTYSGSYFSAQVTMRWKLWCSSFCCSLWISKTKSRKITDNLVFHTRQNTIMSLVCNSNAVWCKGILKARDDALIKGLVHPNYRKCIFSQWYLGMQIMLPKSSAISII